MSQTSEIRIEGLVHMMEQRSPEWYKVRALKMTGSNAQAISANGKGLETYIKALILEHIAQVQERELDKYTGPDMLRGIELEDVARVAYEFDQGVEVQEIGFFEKSDHVGCSPDGLVGEDGVLEIKAKNDAKHLDLLLTEKVDTGEEWQCKFNALVMGRSWTDFVSYNPNFKRSLFVKRILVDEASKEKILKGLEAGEKMLKALLQNKDIKKELS